MQSDHIQIENLKKAMKGKLQTESERLKDKFVDALTKARLIDLDPNWVSDFSDVEFKTFAEYID